MTTPLKPALCVLALLCSGCVLPISGCQSAATAPPASSSTTPAISASDLDRLTGAPWTGTLTYRDYQTNKETTIESTLEVIKLPGLAQVGNDFADAGVVPRWEFRFGYPREPKANSTNIVQLSHDGRRFDNELVIKRSESPENTLRFITQSRGSDNDKPATFRHLYALTDNSFTITKLVKPDDAVDFFERNAYRWKREPIAQPLR